MPTRISVLGSTGSIGTQVLDVARRLGPNRVEVVGLGARSNADLLIAQSLEFKPRVVWIGDEALREQVALALEGVSSCVCTGPEGLDELASLPEADRIVIAIAGTAGLSPTLKAIDAGKCIALASKEVLVAAGHIVMEAAKRKGISILPIDSEHSAIFQCVIGEDPSRIDRIYLTASGGSLRDMSKTEMEHVTPEQALAHPTWKMGRKVTIDSATLMNKGLEIIEAKWLFGVRAEQIEVVIHPQSIIHSMVRYCDGSVIAQLGLPDMRLPIQYALTYPERIDTGLPRLNILDSGISARSGASNGRSVQQVTGLTLTFAPVDLDKFECLALAMEAAREGGTLAVVMNAADEVAVDLFLAGKIGFLDIPRIVREAMSGHKPNPVPSIDEIYTVDAETRKRILCRVACI